MFFTILEQRKKAKGMSKDKIYNQIIDLISSLSLEDKEDLADELAGIISAEIEELPYVPDHHDEHRATEMRALNNSL